MRLLPAGEAALVAEFGVDADPRHHDAVLALDAALEAVPLAGILETVPTYRSLMVHFEPRMLAADALSTHLAALVAGLDHGRVGRQEIRRWRVPACYDGPHAEDLAELSGLLGLSRERVVAAHVGARYRAVMYGFAPGFVYLSGLPEELRVPRRRTPRPPAPSGALTIANGQALIASVAMPTGWYVLGRTPARTFDPARDPAFLIAAGDEIVFDRVDPAQFDALAREAETGEPVLAPKFL